MINTTKDINTQMNRMAATAPPTATPIINTLPLPLGSVSVPGEFATEVKVLSEVPSVSVLDGSGVAVSDGPAVLVVSDAPAVLVVSDGPAVLVVSDGPAVLVVSDGPAVLVVSDAPAVLAVFTGSTGSVL